MLYALVLLFNLLDNLFLPIGLLDTPLLLRLPYTLLAPPFAYSLPALCSDLFRPVRTLAPIESEIAG